MENRENEVLALAAEINQFVRSKTDDEIISVSALDVATRIFGVRGRTSKTEVE
jgi:hypothetical protein